MSAPVDSDPGDAEPACERYGACGESVLRSLPPSRPAVRLLSGHYPRCGWCPVRAAGSAGVRENAAAVATPRDPDGPPRAAATGVAPLGLVRTALTGGRSALPFLVLIMLGAGLRAWQYFGAAPLWLDELAIAKNIHDFGPWALLSQPLELDQSAPVGFLLLTKASVAVFGG